MLQRELTSERLQYTARTSFPSNSQKMLLGVPITPNGCQAMAKFAEW